MVGNDGQNAFLTTAKFFTENNLRFMGVRMLQQNRRVDCLEWENTVECHVANPLMRNTNIKFVLMYQLPYINISVIEKGIWLHGNVSTKSSDINKLNKQWAAKVKLNMKAVPELTVWVKYIQIFFYYFTLYILVNTSVWIDALFLNSVNDIYRPVHSWILINRMCPPTGFKRDFSFVEKLLSDPSCHRELHRPDRRLDGGFT